MEVTVLPFEPCASVFAQVTVVGASRSHIIGVYILYGVINAVTLLCDYSNFDLLGNTGLKSSVP